MTWQPGDPIYSREGESVGYLRDLIEVIPQGEFLHASDAAHWPVPHFLHDLDGPR